MWSMLKSIVTMSYKDTKYVMFVNFLITPNYCINQQIHRDTIVPRMAVNSFRLHLLVNCEKI